MIEGSNCFVVDFILRSNQIIYMAATQCTRPDSRHSTHKTDDSIPQNHTAAKSVKAIAERRRIVVSDSGNPPAQARSHPGRRGGCESGAPTFLAVSAGNSARD